MAERHGAIKPEISSEMEQYQPHQYALGTDISNRTYYGYNNEGDYYYCDPKQEFVVKAMTGSATSNSEKDVIPALEYLTGKPATYTKIQDKTMEELNDMNWKLPVVLNAYDTTSGAANKSHSLLVTKITSTTMYMYDPMDGKTYTVSSPDETFNCGGYSGLIPRNFQHFQ